MNRFAISLSTFALVLISSAALGSVRSSNWTCISTYAGCSTSYGSNGHLVACPQFVIKKNVAENVIADDTQGAAEDAAQKYSESNCSSGCGIPANYFSCTED
jgi:hypothetical protein